MASVTIKLDKMQQSWWLNFITTHKTDITPPNKLHIKKDTEYRVKKLNTLLQKYNAKLSYTLTKNGRSCWITFEDSSYYTWFVLKWN